MTSADTSKPGPAMPMPGTRLSESGPVRAGTSVGKTVVVKGQIFSREDVYVDGEVEGTLELPEHRLTVGSNGKLQAAVKAREVEVLGTIRGNVDAGDRITIRKNSNLIGDIKTASIGIEDGAYFKGSIDILRPETAKMTAAAGRPATVPAPTSASSQQSPRIVPPPGSGPASGK